MNIRRRHAFTMIEVIVVVLTIVLLISLMVPTLRNARSHARTAQCSSNLHQLGLAASALQSQTALGGSVTQSSSLMALSLT